MFLNLLVCVGNNIHKLMKSFKVFTEACWKGYRAIGTKRKGRRQVPNCVPVSETAAWTRKAGKNPEGGLNKKGVASYRAENPGSKLKMAVTTPPSKLKAGSKSANRRKSFCARIISGMGKGRVFIYYRYRLESR